MPLKDEVIRAQAPQFLHTRRVAFCETDMAGIVHFANFYRYMEEAEHAFYRSLDLSIMHHQEDRIVIGWPRVSSQCNYEAPAYYDDMLDIHLNVERIGVKSITYQIDFHRESVRLARGRMKTACCLCKPDGTLESIPIPAAYTSKIQEAPHLVG